MFVNGKLDSVYTFNENINMAEGTNIVFGNTHWSNLLNGLNGYIDNIYFSVGSILYNIAAVEIEDLAFIPSKRSSNMPAENIQWIYSNEINDIILALSSKNNVTSDISGRISLWGCNFSDIIVTQSNDLLMPFFTNNGGIYNIDGNYILSTISTIPFLSDIDNIFVLDFWFNCTNIIGYNNSFICIGNDINNYLSIWIEDSNKCLFKSVTNSITDFQINIIDLNIEENSWYHIAAVILFNTAYIIINGTIVGKIDTVINFNKDGNELIIGKNYHIDGLKGYIDQIRITKFNMFKLRGNEEVGDKIY
jgi:hypothetical protein